MIIVENAFEASDFYRDVLIGLSKTMPSNPNFSDDYHRSWLSAYDLHKEIIFAPLATIAARMMQKAVKKRLVIQSAWGIVQRQGEWIEPHIHHEADYIAICFLQDLKEGVEGNLLVFPDAFDGTRHCFDIVQAKAGRVALGRATDVHMVAPSSSVDFERASFAINFGVVHEG